MCTIHCSILVPTVLANTSTTTKFRYAQLYPHLHPLFIPMLMPQPPPTTPLTCVFRHVQPHPYPLSPFQSNSNTSSMADCFCKPCMNTSRHAMSLCPPFLLVTSLLKYVTSVQYQNIYISSSCFCYPFPNIQYYKACNFISVLGSSIILFKFFCKIFKYFQY